MPFGISTLDIVGFTDSNRINDSRESPRVGVTMGDPAGIGPEIVIKALADFGPDATVKPIVIGDIDVLREIAARCRLDLPIEHFDRASSASRGAILVYDFGGFEGNVDVRADDRECGRVSAAYIEKAVDLWRDGVIDAIATAPISKAAIHLAGYNFPGHTEFLAHLTKTDEFAMSFFAEKLRVVLLSTHVSLRDAIGLVTKKSLVELIRFADKQFSRLLGRTVRIAVAGVNPHASENGMFGDEEAREIEPAIAESRAAGIDVSGPFSADTIFLRGFKGEFDAVVSCYHDQATIAVKCLSFGASVNVTLGLPLIRTSVDHGTAFDIAGQNVAEYSSMTAAIRLAAELARNRQSAAEEPSCARS